MSSPARASREPAQRSLWVPVTLAFLIGTATSLQAFLNGRLGRNLGSAELAASANNLVGLLVLIIVATATGAVGRILKRLQAGARPRWWHLTAGASGALFVIVGATVAPEVGVALLTVALVCGQTIGSLVVDRLGLSPAGQRHVTPARVLGVVLAIGAVAINAAGSRHDAKLGLLALAVVTGAALAPQAAALGHLTRTLGEPLGAALTNFGVGAAIVIIVALIATGGSAPHGWSAPAGEWIGGLLGLFVVLVLATTVSSLGVLRLTLIVVAGQSVGALVLDLIAPAAGETVTVGTVISVLLTLVAVAVSSATLRWPSPRRARR